MLLQLTCDSHAEAVQEGPGKAKPTKSTTFGFGKQGCFGRDYISCSSYPEAVLALWIADHEESILVFELQPSLSLRLSCGNVCPHLPVTLDVT